MKTSKILTAMVVGMIAGTLNSQAQTDDAPLPAIIVIRHGEDIDTKKDGPWPTKPSEKNVKNWISTWAPNWPNYTLPNGAQVQVRQHGLHFVGEQQATWLANKLPALLTKEGVDFMPITRVVTKDPYTMDGNNNPTPNPFDTAWPFIKVNKIQDVVLVPAKKGTNFFGPRANKVNGTVDEGLLKMLPCYHGPVSTAKPADSILPTNASGQVTGSTLIVWDGQGMWGPHDGPWYWADDEKPDTDKPYRIVGANVVRLLGGQVIGDEILNRPQPDGGGTAGKASRLYIFYPRYGTESDKSSAAASYHRNLYGTNVPEYDLMVWDILKDNNGLAAAWKNVVNISVDEPSGTEIISHPPAVNSAIAGSQKVP